MKFGFNLAQARKVFLAASFALSSLSFAISAEAAPSCTTLFSGADAALNQARVRLVHAMSDPAAFVTALQLSEAQLHLMKPVPRSELPAVFSNARTLKGGESHIVVVEIGSVRYALKVFRRRMKDESPLSELSIEPLVIQRALSELVPPAAPKLRGVMKHDQLLKWVDAHAGELLAYGIEDRSILKYAVLMELSPAPSEKSAPELYEDVDRAVIQALHKAVTDLGITSGDIDYIFNSDGEVVLVDFGYYKIQR